MLLVVLSVAVQRSGFHCNLVTLVIWSFSFELRNLRPNHNKSLYNVLAVTMWFLKVLKSVVDQT